MVVFQAADREKTAARYPAAFVGRAERGEFVTSDGGVAPGEETLRRRKYTKGIRRHRTQPADANTPKKRYVRQCCLKAATYLQMQPVTIGWPKPIVESGGREADTGRHLGLRAVLPAHLEIAVAERCEACLKPSIPSLRGLSHAQLGSVAPRGAGSLVQNSGL